MTGEGRVLIIDDDSAFHESYGELLISLGYEVDRAMTRGEAEAKLAVSSWDAVLLDQKLSGKEGGDDGIDILADADVAGAKVLLVTAYASDEAIDRAFNLGAFDYLEKGPRLKTMLKIKLRQIVELNRERRASVLSENEREGAIRAAWDRVRSADSANRKGLALEELLFLLFRSIPGFERTTLRRKPVDEEIDLVVQNASPDPFWQKESAYFLVECKNWSSRVGPDVLASLMMKLKKKHQRARLGFLVAPGGFTRGFFSTLDTERKSKHFVVPIGPEALERLIKERDRNGELKKLHDEAMAGALASKG